MDPFQGIHVEVISNGEVLTLYNDPDDEPSHDPRVRQRYVEAVTGATFEVRVCIDRRFNLFSLCRNDAVTATIYYDSTHKYAKDFLVDALRVGGRVSRTFNHIHNFCPKTGQWKTGDTTFGALTTSETATHVPSVADLGGLGTIKLKFQRVRRLLRTEPPLERSKTSPSATEVSEKVLKGKAITNTVCASNERVSGSRTRGIYDHVPIIDGDGGLPLTYKIFYRSRRTLQMMGCIPQTPSPSPSPAPTNHTNTAREQELRTLRARLAELEGTDTKAQNADSKTKIKREIGELEASDDIQITAAHPAKKKRNTGPIETVDLTAD